MTALQQGYTYRRDGFTFKYGGGRLADISMPGYGIPTAVDCLQAVDYDWQAGEPRPSTTADFRARCDRWLADQAETYRAEAPYLR
jgi:hypothetical protein